MFHTQWVQITDQKRIRKEFVFQTIRQEILCRIRPSRTMYQKWAHAQLWLTWAPLFWQQHPLTGPYLPPHNASLYKAELQI
jgi:hypothetical protein